MQSGNLDFPPDAQANQGIARRRDNQPPQATHAAHRIAGIGDIEQSGIQPGALHQGERINAVATHSLTNGTDPAGQDAGAGDAFVRFHCYPLVKAHDKNT